MQHHEMIPDHSVGGVELNYSGQLLHPIHNQLLYIVIRS